MRTHLKKSVLFALLANVPFAVQADIPECIKDNAIGICLGAGSVGAAIAAYYFGKSTGDANAKEKYTFEENESKRRHEIALIQLQDLKQAAELQRLRDEQRILDEEQITVKSAEDYFGSFMDLYNKYNSMTLEELIGNKTFHTMLFMNIRGTNDRSDFLCAFNNKINDMVKKLYHVKDPELQSRKNALLKLSKWVQCHANNSSVIKQRQNEAEEEQSKVEIKQNKARISAECLLQAQAHTETTRALCEKYEEIAELNAQSARELQKNTREFSGHLDRASAHNKAQIAYALDEIHALEVARVTLTQDALEELKRIHANELAELRRINDKRDSALHTLLEEYESMLGLLPKLNLSLDATRTFLTENLSVLTRIDSKQTEFNSRILNKLADMKDMPEDIQFSIEQTLKAQNDDVKYSIQEIRARLDNLTFQHAQYDAPKPSAPAFSKYNGVTPDCETAD